MVSRQLISLAGRIVMVTFWNEDSVGESIALATELRSKGLRVDLFSILTLIKWEAV